MLHLWPSVSFPEQMQFGAALLPRNPKTSVRFQGSDVLFISWQKEVQHLQGLSNVTPVV